MKRVLKVIISSFLSGVMISLGGCVFLSIKDISLIGGSFLFSIGLFMIISLKLHLFTGKIGYVFENDKSYLLDLFITYLGNILGVITCGYLLRLTRLDNIIDVSTKLAEIKINDNCLSLFILSVFCGILIFLAVELQKKDIPPIFKFFAIIASIMTFICSGFEHSIADAFYFSIANMWSMSSIIRLLVISIGNGLGSIIIWFLLRLYEKNRIE